MRNRRGFTVVELIVVLMIGAILTSIGMEALSTFQSRTSVNQARHMFLSMHARARAQAIEFGRTVELHVDTGQDSIWVEMDGTVLEGVGVASQLGIDISGSGVHRICLSSRGFAEPSCNSFQSPITLTFVQGDRSATAEILPLGQVIY